MVPISLCSTQIPPQPCKLLNRAVCGPLARHQICRGLGQQRRTSVSIVDDWDSYYVDTVGAVLDGTWQGGAEADTWWGLTKDGMGGDVGTVVMGSYQRKYPCRLTSWRHRPLEAALANGDRHAFPCEGLGEGGWLSCQRNAPRAPIILADFPTLVSMDWYIEGINAEIPE